MPTDFQSPPPSAVRLRYFSAHLSFFFLVFVGWLAASRILYEGFFPRPLWLGRPFLTLSLTAIFTFVSWLIWQRGAQKSVAPLVLLPLLLNFIYLADQTVNLAHSRFIFGASLWLALLFWCSWRWREAQHNAIWRWLGSLLIVIAVLPVYLATMSRTVGQADTFEFQVVAPQLGIVHPTGYPLYLLLGKVFTLLPVGSVAWRLNLGTAVLALLALIFLFKLLWRMLGRADTAVLGAAVVGSTTTFWSQAIAAEVYALHALIVCAALWLMVRVSKWQVAGGKWQVKLSLRSPRSTPASLSTSLRFILLMLAAVIGLGLTNHLTTVFLLPPAFLTIIFLLFKLKKSGTQSSTEAAQSGTEPKNFSIKLPITNYQLLITDHRSLLTDYCLPLAFTLPLLLYLYLPLRWQVVNGEAMGLARFVDWVIGGRFQGALQWGAWLNDPARYGIVGRLFVENWGEFNLVLAGVGLGYLAWRQWRLAAVFGVTWLGFTFYCLNYYVPDLAVFLIPAQVMVGIFWACGLTAVFHFITHLLPTHYLPILQSSLTLLLLLPTLLLAANNRTQLDQSGDDGRTVWGKGVLQQPLAANAAILADSEKFPPLFYLQQAEGMRPDLEIMVLPDEAAYRAELDARIAAGQTVYLARFLPGLAGVYHLRSVGALTEVSQEPLWERPSTASPVNVDFGAMRLVGVTIQPEDPSDPLATAVTLYWQTDALIDETLHIFARWAGRDFNGQPDVATGQHAVYNNYPTVAWRPGEIVVDSHSWPRPILAREQTLWLQVAVAPPFTPVDELVWQDVSSRRFAATPARDLTQSVRAQVGSTLLSSVAFATQARPQTQLPILVAGHGLPDGLMFTLQENVLPLPLPRLAIETAVPSQTFTRLEEVTTPRANGRYQLLVEHPSGEAQCGWMRPVTSFCILGEIEVSGVPLPAEATNFEDKIALLDVTMPQTTLQPGGVLDLTLTWQALAPLTEDYTVFVQVLNSQDQIVGQVDSWPVQGTFPTSQWSSGEPIEDRYQVQLASELSPGVYRVQVGLYLLQTLRRLPVVDDMGTAVDDKLLLTGLTVVEQK